MSEGTITEQIFEEVMKAFTKEEADLIRLQRKELTVMGITREPLRTEMACEFAGALLASRKKDKR